MLPTPVTKENILAFVNGNSQLISSIKNASKDFYKIVSAAPINGTLKIGNLQPYFRNMHPCLHRGSTRNFMDLGALVYALQRLPPQAVSARNIFILSDGTKTSRPGIQRTYATIPETRRRDMFYLPPDELEIIVRDPETDIVDCISLLTSMSIEAQNIATRLTDPVLRKDALNYAQLTPNAKSILLSRMANTLTVSYESLLKYNHSLNDTLIPLLANLAQSDPSHMQISFDSRFKDSPTSRNVALWCDRIVSELKQYGDRPIAVVSNNQFGIGNALSGAMFRYHDYIKKKTGELKSLAKLDEMLTSGEPGAYDFAISILSKEDPEFDALRETTDTSLGIKNFNDTLFHTGIPAQIIDVATVLQNSNRLDSSLTFDKSAAINNGLVIVNIDYAFGYQGTDIMDGLCKRLKQQIKHIGILGKAGICALGDERAGTKDGQRFDLMLPNLIITQLEGHAHSFPNGNQLAKSTFANFKQNVYRNAPSLSVPGTYLSSDASICDAIANYNIMQIEMEGGPYVAPIEKAFALGMLSKNLNMYVGYWASDVPIDPNQSLAERHMERGCISAYALTSEMLNSIFRQI